MSVEKLNQEISNLPLTHRLTLVNLIMQSLDYEINDQNQQPTAIPGKSFDMSVSSIQGNLSTKRTALIGMMRGFLKTNQPLPTDTEIKAILEQRQLQKYEQ